jgi:SAM-dependent methyltransferase
LKWVSVRELITSIGCEPGTHAIGVDLTNQALRLTHERCTLEALQARLARTDCENLPFVSNAFDIVYSYGVIHHSPGTIRAVEEIHRVLKTGGVARVMVYHAPSITGAMLWVVHCLLKLRPWKSPRWAVANFLESPGTKTYTFDEAKQLFSAFRRVKLETALGTGDLLLMRRSRRYQNPLARIAWRLYPRWAVRTFGRPFGLGLLITASK